MLCVCVCVCVCVCNINTSVVAWMFFPFAISYVQHGGFLF